MYIVSQLDIIAMDAYILGNLGFVTCLYGGLALNLAVGVQKLVQLHQSKPLIQIRKVTICTVEDLPLLEIRVICIPTY